MTSFSHLGQAILELDAAKRSAETFSWPKFFVDRIDLLLRATSKLRREMTERVLTVAREEDQAEKQVVM